MFDKMLCAVASGARRIGTPHQDYELVTTETCNDVVAAYAAAQFISHLPDQAVTRWMTTGIVHILELIEVNKQQGTAIAMTHHAYDVFLQLLDKAPAIVESCQTIVICELEELGVSLTECSCCRRQGLNYI